MTAADSPEEPPAAKAPANKAPYVAFGVVLALFLVVAGSKLWAEVLRPTDDGRAGDFAGELLNAIAEGRSDDAVRMAAGGSGHSADSLTLLGSTTGLWSVEKVGVIHSSGKGDDYTAEIRAMVEDEKTGDRLTIGFTLDRWTENDAEFGDWSDTGWMVSDLLEPFPSLPGLDRSFTVNGMDPPGDMGPFYVFPGVFALQDNRFGPLLESGEVRVRIGDENEPSPDEIETIGFVENSPITDLELSEDGQRELDGFARGLLDECVSEGRGRFEDECPYVALSYDLRSGDDQVNPGEDLSMEVVDYPELQGHTDDDGLGIYSPEPGRIRVEFTPARSRGGDLPEEEEMSFLCSLNFDSFSLPWDELPDEGKDLSQAGWEVGPIDSTCVPEA
ncbi:hypothetical protein [Salininema proteolyticum]|uniref:DUF4179 domain-containing protein n=2 Tax=Salininema proteolyticum TaxID=1607685 RepID=A0ABV8TWD9_9ACTN